LDRQVRGAPLLAVDCNHSRTADDSDLLSRVQDIDQRNGDGGAIVD
jgi:hypothetical protein